MSGRTRRHARGFTLIELMITVTILAILAVVAIVSYKVYMRRARASEARQMLMEVKMKQEQYFSTYSRYVDAGTEGVRYPSLVSSLDAAKWDWTVDCANAGAGTTEEAWCHLSYRPGPTTFQMVTLGWQPGEAAPASSYDFITTMDFTRRWFYAVAYGDLDQDGVFSTFMMTSQHNDIVADCPVAGSDEYSCQVE